MFCKSSLVVFLFIMVNFAFLGCILYHTGYHTVYLKLASFSDRKTFTKRSPAVNIYQITTAKRTTKYRLSFNYMEWKKHIFQKKQGDLSLLLSIIVERCLFLSLWNPHIWKLYCNSHGSAFNLFRMVLYESYGHASL